MEKTTIARLICKKIQSDKEAKITSIGHKLASAIIRVATTRIFADPYQSIMELPVNSIDSYNVRDVTVGKFGMGFFSILFWIVGTKRKLEIITQTDAYTSNAGEHFSGEVYKLTIFYKNGDLVTEITKPNEPTAAEKNTIEYDRTIHSLEGHDMESTSPKFGPGGDATKNGTEVTILCQGDPFTDEDISEFSKHLYRLRHIKECNIIFNGIPWVEQLGGRVRAATRGKKTIASATTNAIESFLPRIYVTIDKNTLKVVDHASGIDLHILSEVLLIPSISTKKIVTATTKNLNAIDRSLSKTGLAKQLSPGFNRLMIMVADIIIVDVYIEEGKIPFDKDFLIFMPAWTPLPVSRDDVIMTASVQEDFIIRSRKILDELIAGSAYVHKFFDLLTKYSHENRQPIVLKLIDKLRSEVLKRDNLIFVGNHSQEIYSELQKQIPIKFVFLPDVDMFKSEEKLLEIFRPRADIFHFKKVIFLEFEDQRNVVTGGLNEIIFVKKSFAAAHKDFAKILSLSNLDFRLYEASIPLETILEKTNIFIRGSNPEIDKRNIDLPSVHLKNAYTPGGGVARPELNFSVSECKFYNFLQKEIHIFCSVWNGKLKNIANTKFLKYIFNSYVLDPAGIKSHMCDLTNMVMNLEVKALYGERMDCVVRAPLVYSGIINIGGEKDIPRNEKLTQNELDFTSKDPIYINKALFLAESSPSDSSRLKYPMIAKVCKFTRKIKKWEIEIMATMNKNYGRIFCIEPIVILPNVLMSLKETDDVDYQFWFDAINFAMDETFSIPEYIAFVNVVYAYLNGNSNKPLKRSVFGKKGDRSAMGEMIYKDSSVFTLILREIQKFTKIKEMLMEDLFRWEHNFLTKLVQPISLKIQTFSKFMNNFTDAYMPYKTLFSGKNEKVFKLSTKSLIQFVFDEQMVMGESVENWLPIAEEYYSMKKGFDMPLQLTEIAINEGSSKPFINSVLTETLQNSIDASFSSSRSAGYDGQENGLPPIEIDICRLDGPTSFALTITDRIGIPDSRIMAIMIPFLSTKSSANIVTSGEMGSGFFNLYRYPEAKNVVIETSNGEREIRIVGTPTIEGSRVTEVNYEVSISKENVPGRYTRISIVLNDIEMSLLLTTLIDIHMFVNQYVAASSSITGINILYNGKLAESSFEKLWENDVCQMSLITGAEQESIMLVNGLPFVDLETYLRALPVVVEYIIEYTKSGIIINLNKKWYTPVQSRNKIRIKPDELNTIVSGIYESLYYAILGKIKYKKISKVAAGSLITHLYSNSLLSQLKMNSAVFEFQDFISPTKNKYVHQFVNYCVDLFSLGELINKAIDAHTKAGKEKLDVTILDKVLDSAAPLIRDVVTMWIEKKDFKDIFKDLNPVYLDDCDKESEKLDFLTLLVDIFWSIGQSLQNKGLISGVNFLKEKPNVAICPDKYFVGTVGLYIYGNNTLYFRRTSQNFMHIRRKLEECCRTYMNGFQDKALFDMREDSLVNSFIGMELPTSLLSHELAHVYRYVYSEAHTDIQLVINGITASYDYDGGANAILQIIIENGFYSEFFQALALHSSGFLPEIPKRDMGLKSRAGKKPALLNQPKFSSPEQGDTLNDALNDEELDYAEFDDLMRVENVVDESQLENIRDFLDNFDSLEFTSELGRLIDDKSNVEAMINLAYREPNYWAKLRQIGRVLISSKIISDQFFALYLTEDVERSRLRVEDRKIRALPRDKMTSKFDRMYLIQGPLNLFNSSGLPAFRPEEEVEVLMRYLQNKFLGVGGVVIAGGILSLFVTFGLEKLLMSNCNMQSFELARFCVSEILPATDFFYTRRSYKKDSEIFYRFGFGSAEQKRIFDAKVDEFLARKLSFTLLTPDKNIVDYKITREVVLKYFIMLNSILSYIDVDYFYVGQESNVAYVSEKFVENYPSANEGANVFTSKTFPKTQLIKRLYNNITEILLGFDLDSSAVAFDGEKFYYAPRFIDAVVNERNLVDPERQSSSFNKRLMKYQLRGFKIYIPMRKEIEEFKVPNTSSIARLINELILEAPKPKTKIKTFNIFRSERNKFSIDRETKGGDYDNRLDEFVMCQIGSIENMGNMIDIMYKFDMDWEYVKKLFIWRGRPAIGPKSWRIRNPGEQLTGTFNPTTNDYYRGILIDNI